jgi:hypothetical protein
MSKPFVPSPVLLMVVFSTAVCIPIIILSRINFGLLSIWLNAAVAALILVHHFFFILLSWIHHRYPHLNIVGRPSTPQLISSSKTFEAEDEVLGEYELLPMPEIAYSIINVWAVAIIFIVNAVAFCVMVDITSRGAVSSTLPAERIGSHKWNIKIQIGQTSVLGVELLVLLSMLVTCIIGWRRYTEEKERIEAEIECGIALPV